MSRRIVLISFFIFVFINALKEQNAAQIAALAQTSSAPSTPSAATTTNHTPTANEEYQCRFCNEKPYSSMQGLYAHEHFEHLGYYVWCTACKEEFKWYQQCYNHRDKVNCGGKCTVLRREGAITPPVIWPSQKAKKKPKPHVPKIYCVYCGDRRTNTNRRAHERIDHEGLRSVCSNCRSAFKTRQSCHSHMNAPPSPTCREKGGACVTRTIEGFTPPRPRYNGYTGVLLSEENGVEAFGAASGTDVLANENSATGTAVVASGSTLSVNAASGSAESGDTTSWTTASGSVESEVAGGWLAASEVAASGSDADVHFPQLPYDNLAGYDECRIRDYPFICEYCFRGSDTADEHNRHLIGEHFDRLIGEDV